jgi:hypothetical protein
MAAAEAEVPAAGEPEPAREKKCKSKKATDECVFALHSLSHPRP